MYTGENFFFFWHVEESILFQLLVEEMFNRIQQGEDETFPKYQQMRERKRCFNQRFTIASINQTFNISLIQILLDYNK